MAPLTRKDTYEDLVTGQTQAMQELDRLEMSEGRDNAANESNLASTAKPAAAAAKLSKQDSFAEVKTGLTQVMEEYRSDDEAAPLPKSASAPSKDDIRVLVPDSQQSGCGEDETQGPLGFGQEEDDFDARVDAEDQMVWGAQPPRNFDSSSLSSRHLPPYLRLQPQAGDGHTRRTLEELSERMQQAEEARSQLRGDLETARAECRRLREEFEAGRKELREELEAGRKELEAERAARKALEARFDEMCKVLQGKKRRRDGDDEPEESQASRSVRARR